MLHEVIGIPAMLEQTAEECTELAKACLKIARMMRGENAVHKSKEELYANLSEEIADVKICISELLDSGLISYESVDSDIVSKVCRMEGRLKNKDNRCGDLHSSCYHVRGLEAFENDVACELFRSGGVNHEQ